jgi:hypothetical protein
VVGVTNVRLLLYPTLSLWLLGARTACCGRSAGRPSLRLGARGLGSGGARASDGRGQFALRQIGVALFFATADLIAARRGGVVLAAAAAAVVSSLAM